MKDAQAAPDGSAENSSDAIFDPTKTPSKSDENGHGTLSEWQRAGFESGEAFEQWYEAIYATHPTRGGLKIGLHDLAELIAEGTLQRETFDAGYQRWRESAAWAREGGRFVPKLSTFIQDKGWMFPPVEPTPAEQNGKTHAAAMPSHTPTAAERRAERLRNI